MVTTAQRCTWCTETAKHGGIAPPEVRGQRFLYACPTHRYILEHLKYTVVTPNEAKRTEQLEKAQ